MAKAGKRKIQYTDAKKVMEKMGSFEATCVRLPEGVEFFSVKKAGKYTIDILPYVAGQGNPNAEEGNVHYERTYYSHRIGVENNPYCCPMKTFGKKCPVCYDQATQRRSGATRDELKEMEAKIRQLYVVREYDKTGDPGEPMVWDISWHLFGKQLKAKVEALEDYATFFHLEGGYKLIVTMQEESSPHGSFYKTSNIEMVPRKKAIDAEILDQVPCLDDLLIKTPYDKLVKVYEMKDEEEGGEVEETDEEGEQTDEEEQHEDDADQEPEEDEDTAPDEDDPTAKELGIKVGTKVKHKKHGVCVVKHVAGDGTALRIEDGDGELHRAITPKDCKVLGKTKAKEEEPEEEGDDEPAPKKKPGKKAAEPEDDEEEPEESDDEDDDGWGDEDDEPEEDEEEAPKPKKKVKK